MAQVKLSIDGSQVIDKLNEINDLLKKTTENLSELKNTSPKKEYKLGIEKYDIKQDLDFGYMQLNLIFDTCDETGDIYSDFLNKFKIFLEDQKISIHNTAHPTK